MEVSRGYVPMMESLWPLNLNGNCLNPNIFSFFIHAGFGHQCVSTYSAWNHFRPAVWSWAGLLPQHWADQRKDGCLLVPERHGTQSRLSWQCKLGTSTDHMTWMSWIVIILGCMLLWMCLKWWNNTCVVCIFGHWTWNIAWGWMTSSCPYLMFDVQCCEVLMLLPCRPKENPHRRQKCVWAWELLNQAYING